MNISRISVVKSMLAIAVASAGLTSYVTLAQEKPVASPAAERSDAVKADAAKTEKPKSHPAFEKLKALAGEWVDAPEGTDGKPGEQVKVTYRVTGAGTVVCETLFPGSEHEMVTMYHMDGEDLVLTHYCAAGNQPRMKAEKSADAAKVWFKFTGGSNVDIKKGLHMHEATIHFVDADHVKSRWVAWKDGKEDHAADFSLVRKK